MLAVAVGRWEGAGFDAVRRFDAVNGRTDGAGERAPCCDGARDVGAG